MHLRERLGNRSISGCYVLVTELPDVSIFPSYIWNFTGLPSENPLIASFLGFSAIYCRVASNCPSLTIICMTMRALKTIVHVESRSRSWIVRNISATPASPVWVATRMCSMYLDLGAASCSHEASHQYLMLMITGMETI